MIRYHPEPEMLLEFSAGTLGLAHSLCISAHLEFCNQCRQQVQQFQDLGSVLFEETEVPVHSLDSMKSKLFAQLDQEDILQNRIDSKTVETIEMDQAGSVNNSKIPNALRQFVPDTFTGVDWSRVTPSFFFASLSREQDGSELALTRIKPKGSVAHHRHTGAEYTLVLEGSYSDEDGLYQPGDFICMNNGEAHKPIATSNSECICLTLVERPIQFTGWFTRILNPFLMRRQGVSES